jgi:aryl-alcohol dehydrogenase-like predicted oxidoreductase
MGECNKETTFSILDYFYSSGGNFLDTANMYMAGESETWLGEWMELRGVRDEMVVATKYTVPLKRAEDEGKILSNHGGNNKKSLRISLAGSLKRLRTDYADILYVHGWEGTTSVRELMRSLDDVVKSGKVLYLGISNTPAWVVVKANDYARAHALTPFVVYEGRWNAADRDIEREVVPMCKAEGMAIAVWGAMGGGKFKNAEQQVEAGRSTAVDDRSGTSAEDFQSVFKKLEKVGERKGASSMNVAMRYIMLKVCASCFYFPLAVLTKAQAPYVFPICGGRKIDHLKSNIEALGVDLSGEDIREIEGAFKFDLGYPHSTLSGARDKPASAKDPAFVVAMCCSFDGVEEAKVCYTKQYFNPSYTAMGHIVNAFTFTGDSQLRVTEHYSLENYTLQILSKGDTSYRSTCILQKSLSKIVQFPRQWQ